MRKVFYMLLLLFPLGVFATITQKMILKNGSELEGYISMQRPGKNIVFTTEKAVIYMPGSQVKSIVDHEINVSELSSSWKEWAEESDSYIGVGNNKMLVLSDIVTTEGIISRVRVLEKGAKIKYLELNENSYSLNWDTIAVIKADKRRGTALSGTNRVYRLASGVEHEGQYVEEVPGKTLSLYRDNGVIEVFNTADVVKYSKRKINPNQSLFEQNELLDIVQMKDGANLKGVIIEQNYSDVSESDNYLLLQKEDGLTQSIKLKDVVEYRKVPNEGYNPQYDILLREGEVVVNRQLTNILVYNEKGSFVVLESDSCLATVKAGTVVVETHLEEGLQKVAFEVVKVKELHETKSKKQSLLSKKNEEKPTYHGFTYEDIVKNSIRAKSVQTSINKTTKLEYEITEKGLYAIYDSQMKRIIPFRVEE